MTRFVSCPETLDAIIYPPQEKKKKNRKSNFAYSTDFQAMLDNLEDEDCMEESSQSGEKKRRLSFEQVKTLEKIFEADNKLDPERKVTLAQELGLQPRQVAIWFQNRRARWKTKQLERDFGVLKHDYADLQLNFDKLEKEREALIAELQELRAKLGEENTDSNQSVNEETPLLDNNVSEQSKVSLTQICTRPELASPNYEARSEENLIETQGFIGTKYGLLDRNSSEVFDEDGHQRFEYYSDSAYPSSMNCFRLLDSRSVPAKGYSPQIMKMEEESFLGTAEESCNTFFSVDQAPTIHWLS